MKNKPVTIYSGTSKTFGWYIYYIYLVLELFYFREVLIKVPFYVLHNQYNIICGRNLMKKMDLRALIKLYNDYQNVLLSKRIKINK